VNWLDYAKKIALLLLILAGAAFFGVGTYQLLHLPQIVGKAVTDRVDPAVAAIGTRLAARDEQIKATLTEVTKTTKDVSQFISDTYMDNYANVQTATVILRDVAEMTHTINMDILPKVSKSLDLIAGIKEDVDLLTKTTNVDLTKLGSAVDNAATLLASVDEAVKARSSDTEQLMKAATQAVDNVNTLLSDPHLKSAIAHADGISESTDKIFKKLSAKAGVLSTTLKVMLGLVGRWLQGGAPGF
jgi:hypothetical protein